MRPEPGQAQLDARVAAKRAIGMRLVWQQVDAAGISDPAEQADFLLRRLYPEMPDAWFRATIAALTERHARGRWHGFERPEP